MNIRTAAMLAFIFMVIAARTAYAESGGAATMAEALSVASDDFSNRLAKRKAGASKHSQYMAERKNYSVGISESDDLFVIVFIPNDRSIIGGGIEYRVEKKDFRIMKIIGYE